MRFLSTFHPKIVVLWRSSVLSRVKSDPGVTFGKSTTEKLERIRVTGMLLSLWGLLNYLLTYFFYCQPLLPSLFCAQFQLQIYIFCTGLC